jgi:predicted outer membrane protein
MTMLKRYEILLVGTLTCAGLAACNDNDDGDGIEAAGVAAGDGQAMGSRLANRADDELGGQPREVAIGRIGAILIALDGGELAQAQVELDRGDDEEALDYAEMMRDEHTAHTGQVEELLAKRGVAPVENGVSRTLRAEAFAAADDLSLTPRRDVDFAYLELQVKMHAAAGVLVSRLIDLVPDAELLALLAVTPGPARPARRRRRRACCSGARG